MKPTQPGIGSNENAGAISTAVELGRETSEFKLLVVLRKKSIKKKKKKKRGGGKGQRKRERLERHGGVHMVFGT